jgi:gliding motility-associated-like protein
MEITIEDETTTPVVTASTSSETCGAQNGSIDLGVTPSSGNAFLWSNGSTAEDQHALTPGVYSVTVTNAQGCSWSDSYTIAGSVMPVVDLGADLVVEYGQEVSLHAQINVPVTALDTVMWLPGELFSCKERICLDQIFTPTEQTEVILMVFDTNGCMVEESVMVNIRSAINPSVFIPNVFSPNGDGANDAFTVFANPDVEEVVDLRIFDRWGEFVFQNEHFSPNALAYGWDGMYRGKVMDPQVFVYWTRVKFKDGTEEMYKGDVTLIR